MPSSITFAEFRSRATCACWASTTRCTSTRVATTSVFARSATAFAASFRTYVASGDCASTASCSARPIFFQSASEISGSAWSWSSWFAWFRRRPSTPTAPTREPIVMPAPIAPPLTAASATSSSVNACWCDMASSATWRPSSVASPKVLSSTALRKFDPFAIACAALYRSSVENAPEPVRSWAALRAAIACTSSDGANAWTLSRCVILPAASVVNLKPASVSTVRSFTACLPSVDRAYPDRPRPIPSCSTSMPISPIPASELTTLNWPSSSRKTLSNAPVRSSKDWPPLSARVPALPAIVPPIVPWKAMRPTGEANCSAASPRPAATSTPVQTGERTRSPFLSVA